eukprot:scaffold1827_cov421-Prasinococcus_capsulatus_cf.AAC.29
MAAGTVASSALACWWLRRETAALGRRLSFRTVFRQGTRGMPRTDLLRLFPSQQLEHSPRAS